MLLIHELAAATGVPAKTIRYYESVGLLPPARRSANGYRIYDARDADRLRFIAGARSLGFSLDDIDEALGLRDRGEAPCRYMLDLIEREAAQIDRRIADLQRLKEDLAALLKNAQGLPQDDVEGKACVCHLVQNRQRLASTDLPANR
jgi:MerR family copper efflux transcriptional regulator